MTSASAGRWGELIGGAWRCQSTDLYIVEIMRREYERTIRESVLRIIPDYVQSGDTRRESQKTFRGKGPWVPRGRIRNRNLKWGVLYRKGGGGSEPSFRAASLVAAVGWCLLRTGFQKKFVKKFSEKLRLWTLWVSGRISASPVGSMQEIIRGETFSSLLISLQSRVSFSV